LSFWGFRKELISDCSLYEWTDIPFAITNRVAQCNAFPCAYYGAIRGD
jgi:hypothetical protein